VVDHLMLIHAGIDGSAGGGEQGVYSLWAHSWDMYCDNDGDGELEWGCIVQGEDTPDDPTDDIYAANYTHIPEDADIGVVVHEYGHDIGMPDFYDTSGATNNSSSHWDAMNSGSWNGELGGSHPTPFNPWTRWVFGWSDPLQVNYDDPAVEVMIGQSDPTPDGTQDSVWVNLPDQVQEVPNLAGDGAGMNAILGNFLFSHLRTRVRPVRRIGSGVQLRHLLRSGRGLGLCLRARLHRRRRNLDRAAEQRGHLRDPATSTGSTSWMGPGGLTGMHDGRLTYNLNAYAGGSVLLQFVYNSDAGTQNAGFWLDNVALDDGASNLYSNDMEDVSDWTNDGGWQQVPFSLFIPNYYMLEWRNNVGIYRLDWP
jgi:immune inhibitor A